MSQKKEVRLAGRSLGTSRHVCAFFTTKDEEYRVLLPFIKEGFERGDRAFHIINEAHRPEHRRRLEQAGVPVEDSERTGQLEIRRWEDAYLRDGHFDQNRMLALIEEVLQGGNEQGGPLTRLVANMEWALEDRPGVRDIVEYEARLNYILPKFDDAVCCTYDLQRFSADVVMDILRTHPMVIIGGILQENSFFVSPDEMLREMQEREALHAV